MTVDQKPQQSSKIGEDPSDRPPFFSSWSTIYAAVLSFLAFLIILFYLFMKAYS